MFYLGSIAGILPYLLALSLTILWGGHAGLPFFSSGSNAETTKEIVEVKKPTVENLKSFLFENHIFTEKTTVFQDQFFTQAKVLNHYLFRLFDSNYLGISLLRAPPVSLF